MTRSWSDLGIDESLLSGATGNVKVPCPKCGPTARRQGKRDLSVNVETGEFNCWNDGSGCGFSGSLNGGVRDALDGPPGRVVTSASARVTEWRRITKDEYLRRTDPLPPEALEWLSKRGISEATARYCVLRWGVITKDGDRWIKGIYFPYIVKRDGEAYIANVKKRCLCCKDHMQLMGPDEERRPCQLVFYGLPGIAGSEAAVIVEGEMDAVACYEAGIRNVISVPNGATLKSDTARLEYLENCRADLAHIKHVIVATDDDEPGRKLKDELARRIGFEKCSYVVYPDGMKDCNDVLKEYGPQKLHDLISRAKPFPSTGLIRPMDMIETLEHWLDDGMPKGYSTGWKSLDPYFRVVLGQLAIITGIPSHGKSEWLNALLINLWEQHRWRSIIFTPESYPTENYMVKLAQLATGTCYDAGVREKWAKQGFPSVQMDKALLRATVADLHDGFTFISPEIEGRGHDVDGLIGIARQEIYRTGAKIVALDPWNAIDHHVPRGVQKTDYIGECLMKLQRFARHHQIYLPIVAHPTKLNKEPEEVTLANGKKKRIMIEPIPNPYDVADSANWYNKADDFVTIWRDKHAKFHDADPHINSIIVHKKKISWSGEPGTVLLRWDPPTGRFLEPDEDGRTELQHIDDALGDDW